MALALPPDGRITCCDVSREWTDIAREAWADAGVADKVDLRLAPAAETLATLDDDSFDLAFIDADKPGYDTYYEECLRVVRPGGLILIDNVLWSGEVAEPGGRQRERADHPRAQREGRRRRARRSRPAARSPTA